VFQELINRLERYGSTVPLALGVLSVALLIVGTAVPIALALLYVLNGEIVQNATLIIATTSFAVGTPILFLIFSIIRSLATSRAKLAETRNELKARVSELAAARLEAEAANQAKSAFLAQMSHELRTPLNAVMGFSEILMHRELVNPNMTMEDVARYGDMIHHSGGILLSLVNDVLDISKIEAGKLELSPVEVRLGDAMEGVRSCITGMSDKRGVQLRFDAGLDDLMLLVDRRAIDQMLLNILSNAVKFSYENSIIDVTSVLNEGGLSISVTNAGIGMTPAEIEKAADPFTQLSSAMVSSEHA